MAFANIATAIAIGVGTNLISKKIIGDPKIIYLCTIKT